MRRNFKISTWFGITLMVSMYAFVFKHQVIFLVGWADSSKGIANLRKKFVVSTLTNGNVRLMADMVRDTQGLRLYFMLIKMTTRRSMQTCIGMLYCLRKWWEHTNREVVYFSVLSKKLICCDFISNPAVYNGALHYLSVKPEQCAMVAAHIYDLRAAAKQGLRTVYVRRETEDSAEDRASVKSKKEGGEVEIVVDSLEELAILLGCV